MISIPKTSERLILPSSRKVEFSDNEYLAVFVRGEKKVVYKSESKIICFGEYARDHLGFDSDYWVFVYQLSSNYFYAAVIKSGIVQSESTGTLTEIKNEITYDLACCDFILSNTTLGVDNEALINNIVLSEINDSYYTSLEPALNKIKKRRKVKTAIIAIIAAALVSSLGVNYEPEPIKTVKNIDIYEQYKSDVAQQIDASHALQQATLLFAKSLLFPNGMKLDSIEKVGQSLVMKFTLDGVKQEVFDEWLNINKQMKGLLRGDKFVLDLRGSSDRWLNKVVPLGDFSKFIHDYSLDLGTKKITVNDVVTNDHYEQQTINVRFTSDEFAKLMLLSNSIKETPSFLTSLKIIPVQLAPGLSNINLSLTIKGKKNEET
jgi:hypothetical protein